MTVPTDRPPKRAAKPANPFGPKTRKPDREADYRAAIMNDDRLSPAAAWIATCLIFRYWRSGELYAGQKTIAEHAKYSRQSTKTVRNALAELVSRGYLEHIGTLSDRREHYRFTIPVDADTSEPEDAPIPAPEVVTSEPVEPTPEVARPNVPNYDDPWPTAKPEPIVKRPRTKMERRVFGQQTATPLYNDDEPPF